MWMLTLEFALILFELSIRITLKFILIRELITLTKSSRKIIIILPIIIWLISIFVIKGVFPIEVWVKIRTIIILLKRLIPIPTAIIIWKWSLKLRWHLLYRRRRQCSAIYRKLRFIIRLRLIRWTCRKILTLLMLLKMPLLLRVLCGLFCCCCC